MIVRLALHDFVQKLVIQTSIGDSEKKSTDEGVVKILVCWANFTVGGRLYKGLYKIKTNTMDDFGVGDIPA